MSGQGAAARNTRALSMKSIKKKWLWGSITGNRSCNNGTFIMFDGQPILSCYYLLLIIFINHIHYFPEDMRNISCTYTHVHYFLG